MATRGRRRLDAVLLGAGALVGGVVTTVGGIAGDSERVTGMWVGAALGADGGARIEEVIDYDFGLAQEKHGIFRAIPGLTNEAPVTVRSDSAPDAIDAKLPDFSGDEPGVRLRIGDPNTTITGRHRYLIDYELPSGVVMRDPVVAWDAVGTGWDVPIGAAEVHIVAPFELTGLACSAGRGGDEGGCELTPVEPGHVVARVSSLDAHEGITVEAERGSPLSSAPELPAPPASAPPDPGAGLLLPAATASLVGAGAAAATSKLVRRRGRERVGAGGAAEAAWAGESSSEVLLDEEELAHMATTEFAPPQGITAAMGGVILRESVQPEHKVAWLIEAAIEGGIDLVEEGGRAVRLVRTGQGSGATAEVLDTMFGGRHELDLGAYDSRFATGWRQVDVLLADWQHRSGLWDPAGERRKMAARGLGVLAGLAGVLGMALGGALAARWGEEWLPLVAVAALVAGAGCAAVLRSWELRVRTPQGSGLWLRVESFRRFLAGSEAFHAEEAAKRGVLREYTAWAVAVGEIDRWQRSVAAATAIPATAAGLGYVYMAPMLLSSTSATATAPSSSGGGGGGSFGGGGVGGGGGGGGGGSW